MQISKFSDYSLRVLIFLAARQGETATAQAIAEAYDISFHHVAKTAQFLAREGYVVAARGRGGGIALARAPHEISLGDVLRKTEEGSALVECMKPAGNRCVITPVCRLASSFHAAQEAFYRALDDTSLADVTRNDADLRAILMAG